MSHTIRIAGTAETADAEPGDTVLDALLMAGVGFAYSCQAGNCGTCKCELLDGEILELEHSEHALSAADRARGIVLACRTQVWSDVTIRKLDDEEFVVHPSRVLQCRVAVLDRLTHDIWRVGMDIVAGGPFSFSAGQYATVTFGFAPDKPRDYSMANRPDEARIEFHIRESTSPDSVSARLGERLAVGDSVRVAGPLGTSYLREKGEVPVIAIAGGSGMAPIRSILSTLRAKGLRNPVYVYFGARAERDVYGEAEMRRWVEGFASSSAHVVLSDSEAGVGRRTGLITDAVDQDFERLDGFKAYLAGPPAMVEACVALLTRKGVAARDIHADAFYPAPAVAAAKAVA
jgi:CDP-4-dehydro-6-deoxyglucose reductase/ferredoxin-NAD(P)+ reductase (naphthalene dioxygenase ferredoxin-specific)